MKMRRERLTMDKCAISSGAEKTAAGTQYGLAPVCREGIVRTREVNTPLGNPGCHEIGYA